MNPKFCLVLLISLLALGLVGCACGQKPVPVAKAEPAPPPPAAKPMPPKPVATKPVPESVFFATNKSDITPKDEVILRNQAEWLNQNPNVKMRITGNADQRGSEPHNQTLAQKRADAVKAYLVQLGVNPDRLETASYGKNRPICTESASDCYAANRRADLRAVG